jgi:hypothetical protein
VTRATLNLRNSIRMWTSHGRCPRSGAHASPYNEGASTGKEIQHGQFSALLPERRPWWARTRPGTWFYRPLNVCGHSG